MKPNQMHPTREIVALPWSLQSDHSGGYTVESLTAAATLEMLTVLKRIDRKLDALGSDGIHELIRLQVKAARAKKRAAAAKRRALKKVG